MYHERLGKVSFWLIFLGTKLTFFPMHIVGLDRDAAARLHVPAGLGWGPDNLLETIGSY